jgi:hypothetical protein
MQQARLSRQEQTPLQETAPEPPAIISWWDSSNAFSLFGEQVNKNNKDANDDEEAWDVKTIARKRIARLRQGHTTVDAVPAQGAKFCDNRLAVRRTIFTHTYRSVQKSSRFFIKN